MNDLENFKNEFLKNINLDIIGLMCIPPNNKEPSSFFKLMKNLNEKYSLKELSMGMSSDYKDAIKYGATFVRIGSKIFGQRT